MLRDAALCGALLLFISPALAQDEITPSRAVAGTHECSGFYPDVSVRHRAQGKVLIGYDVDAEGNILHAHVIVSSGNEALDAAAVACVAGHWRNTPAMRGTTPVASPDHRAIIEFQLDDEAAPAQSATLASRPQTPPPVVFKPLHLEALQQPLLIVMAYIAAFLVACGVLAFLNWLIFHLRRR